MRVKSGFKLHEVCGQNLLVAEGKENLDFSNLISMNGSSALLWESVQERDFSIEDLADILDDAYQIDDNTPLPREQALQDAAAIVEQWRDAGILED